MSARPSTPASPAVRADEAVEEALASARLEGLEPSPEVVEDARLVAAGDLDPDDLITRTLARHKR
ncbi:MAG: antitoxin VbhA family protein [Acidimicrobiales bacterium]|nr:antitoxin VbhA family protein [Acidimicrobiales bacterium]